MKKGTILFILGIILGIIVFGGLLLLVTANDGCEIVTITDISNGRITLDNGYSLTIQSTQRELHEGDMVMFFSKRSLLPILNRFVVGNSIIIPTANITAESIEMVCHQ